MTDASVTERTVVAAGRFCCAIGWCTAIIGLGAGTAADAQSQSVMVDVVGGVGYATNPFLVDDGSTASATSELSILPRYSIVDERGQFAIEASYRRTQYLRRYGGSDAYGVRASATRRLSEKLDGEAFASFDSSILGEQARRRIIDAPVPVVDGVAPAPLPEFSGLVLTSPDLISDIGLVGLRQRQNQLNAGAGLTYALSQLDQVSGQVVFNRVSYGGDLPLANFRTYAGSIAYRRALSELTQAGGRLIVQATDYDVMGFSNRIYQPQATIDSKLSPLWSLSAALGAQFISSTTPAGTRRATGISGSVAANRTDERSALMIRVSRDAVGSGLGGVTRIIGAFVDHSFRLNETDAIRWSASVSNSRQMDSAFRNGSFSLASINGSYNRRLSERIEGGASIGFRNTFGRIGGRSGDLAGQLFIRARLGDLR